jgi:undecaprenyl diphosphate synthase
MEREKPKIPAHVGIIMDGNGRWAAKRGKIRTQGHLEGLNAAKRVVKAASDLGVSYLTLYTFSTENWKRSIEETGFIMALVKQYLRGELAFYRENSIRIRHAGSRERLPQDILRELDLACEETRDFSGLQVILALNYGGRDEMVRAIKRMAGNGFLEPGAISHLTEDIISTHMDNPDVPDPDLIIRTAGEFRISNFLVWEGAYSEYCISDKLWPDWEAGDLLKAVNDYGSRNRRFGGLGEKV